MYLCVPIIKAPSSHVGAGAGVLGDSSDESRTGNCTALYNEAFNQVISHDVQFKHKHT